MNVIKCIFEKDTSGMWILPAIGYSNIKGDKALWIGWLYWIFKVEF